MDLQREENKDDRGRKEGIFDMPYLQEERESRKGDEIIWVGLVLAHMKNI